MRNYFWKWPENKLPVMRLWLNRRKGTWGQISFNEKASQNMLTNPFISKMLKTHGQTPFLVWQLRWWWVWGWDPVGSHLPGCRWKSWAYSWTAKFVWTFNALCRGGHVVLLLDKCGMLLSKWNLFSNPGLLGWALINHSPAVVRAGYMDPESANSWSAADLCPENWYSPEKRKSRKKVWWKMKTWGNQERNICHCKQKIVKS